MASSIVGIDIGNSTVRAVEVINADKGRPTLVRFQEMPLPEGAVSRGEVIEPNTVANVLKNLWSSGGFKSKDVVLGMGNQRVLARDLTVPKMSISRIRESLPFQVQDLLPVPVADAILDFYPVSESVGETGPVVHGLLIAAVKDAVMMNVGAAQLAGLTTAEVDLIPFALMRLHIARPGLMGTVVLVDIGANTTSVVIAKDGVPQFVRLIPTGGADLTLALRTGLEIELDEAERIKRSLGLAKQVESIQEQRAIEIIYKVTSDLLGSLRNTLNYFVNTRPDEAINQIVMSGGGSELPGFPEALAEMTRIPVVIGDPLGVFALSRKINAAELRQARSSLGVALGLALGSAA
jgi:type IV pilus assembly protein PilM